MSLLEHFFTVLRIRDGDSSDPGWEKVGSGIRDKHPGTGIRDKHPGSATLLFEGFELLFGS
jgi:hypothetical protein